MGIIYCATNKIDGKIYIGKCQSTLQWRIRKHLKQVAEGSTYYFHNAIRKHGIENFSWRILDSLPTETTIQKKHLSDMEKVYIEMFGACFKEIGYNHTHGGEGVSLWGERHYRYGKHCSEELKKKISDGTFKKKVRQVETGIVFKSIREASKQLSIDERNITNVC